ncbi:hypothetical protein [Salegentibacter mishustinae]|jgi:chaperonin cofactor prefoldin|uniref:Uncharacterized protein n=1 Tax=Salegentibacter mishustinae TaxID=270918 RepID=A0A0Q9ZGQ4_9FLAO|nr:hypothetical protein [Salegentibacter mishustinae]KRG28244.1 hypothetical protein APR42_05510 [Salegentibacter mishustinae]PNW22179.1 hypothetical protein APB85_13275 [Salegentibacter mishustinae]PZX67397.1 hypothetical protein LY54_00127 [Salegentibacter mishustinae]GGW80038.1 hypothetical protein GCM10008086_04780 [Salegentibacter mishustinae]
MKKLIEARIEEMENLLEDFDYDDDEKLQDLYYQIQDMFGNAWEGEFDDKKLQELEILQNRFDRLNKEWETPDERRDATLNMMFPDEDSREGFDVDDFFGLD